MTDINNAAVLKFYSKQLAGWSIKALGAKPTAAQLNSVHHLGARHGKQCLANAMSLRDCGVTAAQIIQACGAPQLNKMRGFIADGLLKRLAVPADDRGHTVYKCEVTPKGNKRIEASLKREQAAEAAGMVTDAAEPAKPAKAKPAKKATSKPRKPRLPVVDGTVAQLQAAQQHAVDMPPADAATGEPEAAVNG